MHNPLIRTFAGQSFACTLTPAEHLRAWFTPDRRKLISARAVDVLAGRPIGTFHRFLTGVPHVTLGRTGLSVYYPVLALIGYVPPNDTQEVPNVAPAG